jgi:hypothetical protein
MSRRTLRCRIRSSRTSATDSVAEDLSLAGDGLVRGQDDRGFGRACQPPGELGNAPLSGSPTLWRAVVLISSLIKGRSNERCEDLPHSTTPIGLRRLRNRLRRSFRRSRSLRSCDSTALIALTICSATVITRMASRPQRWSGSGTSVRNGADPEQALDAANA